MHWFHSMLSTLPPPAIAFLFIALWLGLAFAAFYLHRRTSRWQALLLLGVSLAFLLLIERTMALDIFGTPTFTKVTIEFVTTWSLTTGFGWLLALMQYQEHPSKHMSQ